jgi:hypothetical protein
VDGTLLRNMLESILPAPTITAAVLATGFQRRHRKLDPIALVRALVLSGGTPDGGRQADALRAYLEQGVPAVVRGAFYAWFNEPLGALMADLGAKAAAYALSMPTHLPGILAGVRDWRAVDSTVVKLRGALAATFPGTGDYASLKVHKEYSLGVENVVAYHITSGRDHDGPELVVDEKRRGTGLVVDLGYASHDMLRKCRKHDVQVIIKLKDGWNVFLDESVSAAQRATWVVGSEFEGHLRGGGDVPLGKKGAFDIDVTVGPEGDPIPLRLVGVPNERGYCTFLTTLPRSTHSLYDIGTLYRLRWAIEVDNKLSKSACRLDHVQAETMVSALVLVHAAMIASILANAIVHADHVGRGCVGMRVLRLTSAPLHPMLVAKMVAQMADRLSVTMADHAATSDTWDRLAVLIQHMGRDPNWRRRPSAIDEVKGRVGTRGRKRADTAAPRMAQNA